MKSMGTPAIAGGSATWPNAVFATTDSNIASAARKAYEKRRAGDTDGACIEVSQSGRASDVEWQKSVSPMQRGEILPSGVVK